jgi:enamine deaminase RidA (YjgF/YER057c/UK114 family)
MNSSWHPNVTTRRSFLRQGATLAGAVTLPMTCTGTAEAGLEERGPVRVAQRGAGTVDPTSSITTKSTRLVGSSIDYAYAVKAGPWVFLNGHEAFDFAHGLAPEVEGQPSQRLSGRPPLRREADYLLRRMRSILKEFGTDLPNAVRVDQYYTMAPAVSAYHLARFAEFGDYIPPSTSIIMERCFSARANTHTSMIAVVPERGYEVDKFILPGQAISASGYNPAVAASDFVFVAGNMALRPDGTIDPKVHVLPGRNWGGETAFRRQVRYIITERLEPSLKTAGSALEHSLKAQAYIRGVENLPDFMEVWAQHFRDIPCAVTLQGALLLSYMDAVCKAVGVSAANVVRAQYFLTDIRDFAGIARAWQDRYGRQPHPFASVQVPGPMPITGAVALADFWVFAA